MKARLTAIEAEVLEADEQQVVVKYLDVGGNYVILTMPTELYGKDAPKETVVEPSPDLDSLAEEPPLRGKPRRKAEVVKELAIDATDIPRPC